MPSKPKRTKAQEKAQAKSQDFEHSRNGLREALLGLLAIRPMSGYDLTRSYERALQQIWYAPLKQIYPTLRKMQGDGLLKVAVKVQRDRPNRKVYSLTAEGRQVLTQWLATPAVLPRMHHEFIHKLFLRSHVEPAGRAEWVDAYAEACTAWAGELRRAERALEPSLKGSNPENAWFQLLSLRHLCRIVECEAASARELAADIREFGSRVRRQTALSRQPEKTAFGGLSLSPAAPARFED